MKVSRIFFISFLLFEVLVPESVSGQGRTDFRKVQTNLYREPVSPVVSRAFLGIAKDAHVAPVVAWVFLTDKGFRDAEALSERLFEYGSGLLGKTLRRRAKMSSKPDFTDLPVNEEYVEEISRRVRRLRHRSRWFNAVSVEVAAEDLPALGRLPFIAKVEPLPRYRRSKQPVSVPVSESVGKTSSPDTLLYGNSFEQNEQINAVKAHLRGYSGEGVLVAMFDTGFLTTHNAFRHIVDSGKLVAQRDFVFSDDVVDNEPGDTPSAHSHGTVTWSAVGGYEEGMLIGVAYGASFLLAKSEDVRSETPAEEDNWVAAIEWAEELGADVISSSLAYFDFDGAENDYDKIDLDGETGLATIAADLAVSKGVTVVTAMGNEGPRDTTLWMPADGDYVIASGAVNALGVVASFSSRGPTYDGRIKPEVSARGVNTTSASAATPGSYGTSSGTSLSTPLVAGAAALVIEAHPDWTPLEVRDALMKTASNACTPDNSIGWGIVDITAAIDYTDDVICDSTLYEEIMISSGYPNPSTKGMAYFHYAIPDESEYEDGAVYSITIFNLLGQRVRSLTNGVKPPGTYFIQWEGKNDAGVQVPSGIYIARFTVGNRSKSGKIAILR